MVAATRKQRDLVFKAIADSTRREILRLLSQRQHTLGDLAANFRISRPAISKHVRILRGAGLVATRRSGTSTVCDLNARPLQSIHDWLRDYERFWNETLLHLKNHVEGQHARK